MTQRERERYYMRWYILPREVAYIGFLADELGDRVDEQFPMICAIQQASPEWTVIMDGG